MLLVLSFLLLLLHHLLLHPSHLLATRLLISLLSLHYVLLERLETPLGCLIQLLHSYLHLNDARSVLFESSERAFVLRQSRVAPDDMLEESGRVRVSLGLNHIFKNCGDSEESVGCLTQVVQTLLVMEDLLYNEGGDCF